MYINIICMGGDALRGTDRLARISQLGEDLAGDHWWQWLVLRRTSPLQFLLIAMKHAILGIHLDIYVTKFYMTL